MTSGPDVSVVVAVYNTMPHVTECLNSLVQQTIGLDRMEIIAVDDGSTDTSGKELDRFAELYPDTVRVVHQTNSGGPAGPSNKALDMATGRYVFFVGSDDWLGLEALERLVAMGDEHGSDVVLGKMVAVGERSIPRAVFRSTEPSIPLIGSGALYAISNTKLYRRALIEEHGLRFPEHLLVSSDMPFTLEAYVRAETISVLADYDCYYAVRRSDDSNITYRARFEHRLRVCAYVLDRLLEISGPGELYDEFALRLLKVDLSWIFGENFLAMDPEQREKCVKGTAEFLEKYYAESYESLEPRLTVPQRLRFRWVLRRNTGMLAELVGMDVAGRIPETLLEGDRAYARYTGFRDDRHAIPDSCFQLLGSVSGRLGQGIELIRAAWEGTELAVIVRLPVIGGTQSVSVRLARGAMPKSADRPGARRLPDGHRLPALVGRTTAEPTPDGLGTLVGARIPVHAAAGTWGVRVYAVVAGSAYEIPVPAAVGGAPLRADQRSGLRRYRYTATANKKGRLVVSATAGGPLRVLARALRHRVPGSRRK